MGVNEILVDAEIEQYRLNALDAAGRAALPSYYPLNTKLWRLLRDLLVLEADGKCQECGNKPKMRTKRYCCRTCSTAPVNRRLEHILRRFDNERCDRCLGKPTRRRREALHVHHIVPRSVDHTQTWLVSNLVVLCQKCHRKRHNQ